MHCSLFSCRLPPSLIHSLTHSRTLLQENSGCFCNFWTSNFFLPKIPRAFIFSPRVLCTNSASIIILVFIIPVFVSFHFEIASNTGAGRLQFRFYYVILFSFLVHFFGIPCIKSSHHHATLCSESMVQLCLPVLLVCDRRIISRLLCTIARFTHSMLALCTWLWWPSSE